MKGESLKKNSFVEGKGLGELGGLGRLGGEFGIRGSLARGFPDGKESAEGSGVFAEIICFEDNGKGTLPRELNGAEIFRRIGWIVVNVLLMIDNTVF